MRFCYGTFGAVLKRCGASRVTQKALNGALLCCLTQDDHDKWSSDDETASKLFSCTINVPPGVTEDSRKADVNAVIFAVTEEVVPLLDPNKRRVAILAIRDLIRQDQSILSDTVIDEYQGLDKASILNTNRFHFDRFIAGCLKYVVAYPDNTEGRDCITGTSFDEYVDSFNESSEEITLLDSPAAPLYEGLPDTNTETDALRLQQLLEKADQSKPDSLEVPHVPSSNEMVYTTELLNVYAEAEGKESIHKDQLDNYPRHKSHFNRQRRDFYAAESIRRGMRDVFGTKDADAFDELKEETYSGVIDTCEEDYPDGYARLRGVLTHAGNLDVSGCTLGKMGNWIRVSEKKGVCHMLVNDHRIRWITSNE